MKKITAKTALTVHMPKEQVRQLAAMGEKIDMAMTANCAALARLFVVGIEGDYAEYSARLKVFLDGKPANAEGSRLYKILTRGFAAIGYSKPSAPREATPEAELKRREATKRKALSRAKSAIKKESKGLTEIELNKRAKEVVKHLTAESREIERQAGKESTKLTQLVAAFGALVECFEASLEDEKKQFAALVVNLTAKKTK